MVSTIFHLVLGARYIESFAHSQVFWCWVPLTRSREEHWQGRRASSRRRGRGAIGRLSLAARRVRRPERKRPADSLAGEVLRRDCFFSITCGDHPEGKLD
jgi:hypothetical protein